MKITTAIKVNSSGIDALKTMRWDVPIREQSQDVLVRARELAPIKTGALIRSGRVNKTANPLEFIIKFSKKYAIYMHERFYRAKIKGGRKFLDKAIREKITNLSVKRAMLKHLRDALARAKVSTRIR